MRVPAALLALPMLSLALSGCVGDDSGGEPDFTPTCPSWIVFSTRDDEGNTVRPKAFQARQVLFWNNTSGPDGPGSWPDTEKASPPITPGSPGGVMLNGEHPVDFYDLAFDLAFTLDADTSLEVKTEGGRPLLFKDLDTGRYASILRWPDGTNTTDLPTYRVELAQPGEEPAPEAIVLHWKHVPNKDNDARTDSFSAATFDVTAWFRTC